MPTRPHPEGPTVGDVHSLLHRFGLRAGRVRRMPRADCEIHRITAGTLDLQLRIYAPARHNRSAIETELDWLQQAADDGLHVPRPQVDADGLRLVAWQPRGAARPRHAVLLTWLSGRQLDRGLTPARLTRVGRLIGRLHGVAARLAHTGRIQTQRAAVSLDLHDWATGNRRGSERLPDSHRGLLQAAAARLLPLLSEPAPRRFIHGDLHLWNLLFHWREAGAIDFTDCGWGEPAMDLASTLQYLKWPLAGNHDHRAHYHAGVDARRLAAPATPGLGPGLPVRPAASLARLAGKLSGPPPQSTGSGLSVSLTGADAEFSRSGVPAPAARLSAISCPANSV